MPLPDPLTPRDRSRGCAAHGAAYPECAASGVRRRDRAVAGNVDLALGEADYLVLNSGRP
jgi:hypothetical protein